MLRFPRRKAEQGIQGIDLEKVAVGSSRRAGAVVTDFREVVFPLLPAYS